VFTVRNAIFRLVHLNALVKKVVSFPMYKCCPFVCCSLYGWLVFLWSRVGRISVLDWEGVVVHNVVYDVFLLSVLTYL
jgi:hypothetical protein